MAGGSCLSTPPVQLPTPSSLTCGTQPRHFESANTCDVRPRRVIARQNLGSPRSRIGTLRDRDNCPNMATSPLDTVSFARLDFPARPIPCRHSSIQTYCYETIYQPLRLEGMLSCGSRAFIEVGGEGFDGERLTNVRWKDDTDDVHRGSSHARCPGAISQRPFRHTHIRLITALSAVSPRAHPYPDHSIRSNPGPIEVDAGNVPPV